MLVFRRMNKEKIEMEVRKLHEELWNKKEQLLPNQQATPFQLLSPRLATSVLGLEYLELEQLGSSKFSFRGQKFRVAGLIDRQAKKIAVSTEFSSKITRFTAIHEIGHWLLHPDEIMHRDRPIGDFTNTKAKRPKVEREADYFSACFLMPERLLESTFKELFMQSPFTFNDETSFHLNPNNPNMLLRTEQGSLDRELALANCTSFNGRNFPSLAEQFGVSSSAMAIRIKELGIVRWP